MVMATVRVRVGIAAAMMGVSVKTVRRWDAAGKITCSRTAGCHRRISLGEIVRINGEMTGDGATNAGIPREGVAVYCRVSSHEQKTKGDIDR
ncbi:MerR family DNA-binding transcriptional regulator [Candidatus Bathyarchaeota archaeon]|nr:MerR family DNA-binding transcriptional regulator [Candidatus Bathyarchaeota archaeon]